MTVEWQRHAQSWRKPAQVLAHWAEAAAVEPSLLHARTRGAWWDVLGDLEITLLITREYEHLVVGACVVADRPVLSFLPLPHPSGLALTPDRTAVVVASTRNPNQVFRLETITPTDELSATPGAPRLAPLESRVAPGRLYLHDLAFVSGALYGSAVGENAVVRLHRDRPAERAWWPACIDTPSGPRVDRNYLQLNSIAAGPTLDASFFTASTDRVGRRRPGHHNFAVDGRGVVFSGTTREPVVRGLTRPHSARLHGGDLWVDNSGYGEVGVARDGALEVIARLPGWTRGLCFWDDVAFVATSRVIPEYHAYAPGLDVETSECGVHALDANTGAPLGSLVWPEGNQVFGVEAVPAAVTSGLPFDVGRRSEARERGLFFSFASPPQPSGASSPGGHVVEERHAE
jgi:uncharacterized protein (TIGR03032 family)